MTFGLHRLRRSGVTVLVAVMSCVSGCGEPPSVSCDSIGKLALGLSEDEVRSLLGPPIHWGPTTSSPGERNSFFGYGKDTWAFGETGVNPYAFNVGFRDGRLTSVYVRRARLGGLTGRSVLYQLHDGDDPTVQFRRALEREEFRRAFRCPAR